MKPTDKTDIVCINKVLKYIALIRKAYSNFNIKTLDDLEANDICQLAITQAITNIYEVKKKIRADALSRVPSFDKILLKAARNIASHDYDSLDFEIIYKRTLQLLKPEVSEELEAAKHDFQQYTSSNSQS